MGTSNTQLRVMLVDSNLLFRAGIARLIESQPDMVVVGECDTCKEALHMVADIQPDVMLLEVETRECDGFSLLKLIKQQWPDVHLIVLTTDINPNGLLGALLSGASGYLQKTISPDELFARLRGLYAGEAAMSLTTVTMLINRLNSSNCSLCLRAVPNPNLTPRESDILKFVARGLTNRNIGAALQISEHTVRNHLCSVYDKLNLKNRLQVAVYSVTHGLVNLDE
ncbi:MAG: response regulator transcription factor [Anaerolineae bacterium]|nr:response regulator transcription factor [Anaerolineae bacterium]